MGQLISLIAVVLFSLTSVAQGLGPLPKTVFSPLIEQNILEQELTAEDVLNSTLTASAAETDSEPALVDSVKTIPTGNGAATVVQQPAATEKRNPANEKDFQVKLHPTGLSSAKRYFPPKPKVVKAVKASKKSAKLAKAEKKTKVKKSKGNGRSTASIKKKTKKSTSQTTSSVKI